MMWKTTKKRIWISSVIMIAVLNFLFWKSTAVCDFGRKTVFHWLSGIMGFVSGLFPFSLGEKLLYLAVILVAFWLLFILIRLIVWLFSEGPKAWFDRFFGWYGWLIPRIAIFVAFIMTINCFMLYHCNSFATLYIYPENAPVNVRGEFAGEYTVEELIALREIIVKKANALAPLMERDEQGYLNYDASWIKGRAREEMARMGETYEPLAGKYVTPKELSTSKFFSQQHMLGYYFPFSMEANYNGMMYVSNMPATLCHELSHTKGFIYENDANFIAYLACITSEDPFFQYSGYLSVLGYVDQDVYKMVGAEGMQKLTPCAKQVIADDIFLTKEAWAEVEQSAVIETKKVQKASNAFLEANQQMNGVTSGIASYSEVVGILLAYYDSIVED